MSITINIHVEDPADLQRWIEFVASIDTASKSTLDIVRENTRPAAPAEEAKTEEPAPKTRTRKAKDAAPAISANPEDRKPPEDDVETQEQDAVDEKAEVEAAREPEKPLTVEDVKAAVGLYVQKHGMPATQEDGVKIFVAALGKPPAGQDFWKMSLLADATQSQLQKTIAEWTAAAGADKRFGAKE